MRRRRGAKLGVAGPKWDAERMSLIINARVAPAATMRELCSWRNPFFREWRREAICYSWRGQANSLVLLSNALARRVPITLGGVYKPSRHQFRTQMYSLWLFDWNWFLRGKIAHAAMNVYKFENSSRILLKSQFQDPKILIFWFLPNVELPWILYVICNFVYFYLLVCV